MTMRPKQQTPRHTSAIYTVLQHLAFDLLRPVNDIFLWYLTKPQLWGKAPSTYQTPVRTSDLLLYVVKLPFGCSHAVF